MLKGGKLKHAHRAVPDDGASRFELGRQPRGGLRTNVKNQVVVRHRIGRLDGGRGVCREAFGSHHIAGDRDRGAACAHGGHDRACLGQQVGLGQTLANLQASSQHEGVGNAATDDQLVHLVGQALEDSEFGRHLGAGHDRHQRAAGVGQRQGDGIHFGRQQRAGAGHGSKLGNAIGGGFGAVRRAKGVVHKNIAQAGHLACQRLAVFLLADIDAAVFQQHQLTRLDGYAGGPVGQQRDRAAQELGQALSHRGQRVGRREHALGRTAQVGGDHHGGAGIKRHADARQGGANTGIFGNGAMLVLRHIQVCTDENTLAGHPALSAQVCKTKDIHGRCRKFEVDIELDCRSARNRLAMPRPGCRYHPSPMCSGRYTAMPARMVPSTACPAPRRQKYQATPTATA